MTLQVVPSNDGKGFYAAPGSRRVLRILAYMPCGSEQFVGENNGNPQELPLIFNNNWKNPN